MRVPFQVSSMKFFNAEVRFRPAGIAADLVHRDKRIVDIESRVFEPLSHDGPGELLPSHREVEVFRLLTLKVPGGFDKQYTSEKIEGCTFTCRMDCVIDKRAVGFRDVGAPNVGTVSREASCNRYKGFSQILASQISGVPVRFGKFGQPVDEGLHLTGKQFSHDLTLAFAKDLGEGLIFAGDLRVYLFELPETLRIDECSIYIVREVVARRSFNFPVVWDLFICIENLFNSNEYVGQPVEICLRVAQAIDVVDAQAGDFSFGDEF